MDLFDHTLDFTLVAALLMMGIHLFGPAIRQGIRLHVGSASSFGGGLAVAYVFLKLFPEVEASHEWLGDWVHLVTLVSFLAFYAFELFLLQRGGARSTHGMVAPISGGDQVANTSEHLEWVFWWHIAVASLYVWMVVFALPEEVASDFELTMLTSVAVGLHLVYKDYVVRVHRPAALEYKGQIVLAAAPMLGWLTHVVLAPSEAVSTVFFAVLAGFLMQNVFRDELPSDHLTRLPWVFGGAAAFAILAFLLG